MKYIYEHLNNFLLTHLCSILIFASIYYYLLCNIDEHFLIVNKDMKKSYYTDNKILNAFFISINLETSTGYIDLNTKSILSRSICMLQMCITLLITLNAFRLFLI